jgi:hypothetical protein
MKAYWGYRDTFLHVTDARNDNKFAVPEAEKYLPVVWEGYCAKQIHSGQDLRLQCRHLLGFGSV